MTTLDEVEQRVLGIFTEGLGPAGAGLTIERDLRDVDDLESVHLLQMIAEVEEVFDVEFEDEVIFQKMTSLRDLARETFTLITS
jgi:acyl carrier protein